MTSKERVEFAIACLRRRIEEIDADLEKYAYGGGFRAGIRSGLESALCLLGDAEALARCDAAVEKIMGQTSGGAE